MSRGVRNGIAFLAVSCFALAPAVVSAQPEEDVAAEEEAAAAEEEAAAAEEEAAAAEEAPVAEEAVPEPEPEPLAEPEPMAEPAPEPEPAAAAAAAEAGEAPEEIVVTGTRIKRKGIATAAPITVLTREDLLGSGMVSIGEILQNLPSQGNALNVNFNNGGNGATRVNMRGLDANRTLVLVNGRRHVAGGDGADSAVDLNAIPISIIERVEVLKDGASAVYGSDAVAGVVNVITRQDFDGALATGYTGITQRGDGEVYDISVMAGATSGKGSILFAAGYYEQLPIWAGDRDFADLDREYNFAPACGTTAPDGHIYNKDDDDCFDPDVDGGPYSDDLRIWESGSSRTPQGTIIDRSGDPGNAAWQAIATGPCQTGACFRDPEVGWRDFNGDGNWDTGTGDLYNYQPDNYLLTPQKRYNVWTSGKYDFSEYFRAYFEGSYSNRKSNQKLAPEPLDIHGEELVLSAENRYNPYGRDFTDVRRRMVEQGNRIYRQDIDTFRLVLGVKGALPDLGPLMDWDWDLSVNFGRTEGTNVSEGLFVLHRLARALGPDSECTGDCVPLNLLGGEGTITPEMLDYISYTGVTRGWTEQRIVSFGVGGPLYELVVGNPIGVAAGYEFRREAGAYVPDPIFASGDTTGNKGEPTRGAYKVHAGYLELNVPVFGGVTGAELIELNAAVRAFNYDTFSGTDLTYKGGLRWQIMDYLAARGTYSTAYRAPSVSELYSGNSDSFPAVTDPCATSDANNDGTVDPNEGRTANARANCAAAGVPDIVIDPSTQLRAQVGGNPDLEPETAKILTAGIVLEPTLLKGLSAAVDYWRIRVENGIQPTGAGIILNSCYEVSDPDQRQFCELVERDSAGVIRNIYDVENNVAGVLTSGLDFDVRYSFPTPYGRFGASVETTYLIEYKAIQPDPRTPGAEYEWEYKGTYDAANATSDSNGGVYPDWRVNGTLLWSLGSWNAGYNVRWISGGFTECDYTNLCHQPLPEGADDPVSRDVDGNITMDLFAGYSFDSFVGETDLTVGVNNLLDQDPPTIYTGFLADSDAATYDYMGRYFYARLGHKF